MLLAFLANFCLQGQSACFIDKIWGRQLSHSLAAIPLLRAENNQSACQKFMLDQYRDDTLTCKEQTGTIASHDHVICVYIYAYTCRHTSIHSNMHESLNNTTFRGDLMMMIAFITIKSSLVPLIEGLCAQIYFRFEISVVCSHLLLLFFVKEKTC